MANVPTNKALYNRVKAEAKSKFDTWPSAYGSAWLVKTYKKRGGGYRKAQMGMEVENPYADMYSIGGGIMTGDYEMGYGGTPEYGYGGQEYSEGGMPEYKSGGGIPQRYKNKGFTKVGAKKKSTRPGKKWMVLAKKGDQYKIVHGGDSNMKDFKQHGSAKRKKRFWDRMGGRNGSKAKDPFSPLYWHKRFGTWAEGGEMEFEPHMMYNPQTGEGFMAEEMQDHLAMDKMGFTHDAPEMGYGGNMYANGGTNNAGFKALPKEVQDNIIANMMYGGDMYAMGGAPCYECGGATYGYGGTPEYQYAGQTLENSFTEEEDMQLRQYEAPEGYGQAMNVFGKPSGKPGESYGNAFAGKYASGYLSKNGKLNPTLQLTAPGMDSTLQLGVFDAVGGLSRIAGNMGKRKKERRARNANMQRTLTDNLYAPIEQGSLGSRGNYNTFGELRPDRVMDANPYTMESFLKEGGETELTDAEIARLRAMGADIEILD